MSLTTRTYEKAVGFDSMTDDELFYVNGGSGSKGDLYFSAGEAAIAVGGAIAVGAKATVAVKTLAYAGAAVAVAYYAYTAYNYCCGGC
jgi:hypothetical protein